MAKKEIYCYDENDEPCFPAAFTRVNDGDAETYEADLDWFFNVYDSECGLRSVGLGGLEMAFDSDGCRHKWSDGSSETVHMRGGHGGTPVNDPWSDERHLSAFARGRAVWQRLGRVTWTNQAILRRAYEPAYPREPGQDWGMPMPDRNAIVEAIREFRGVGG